MTTVIALRGPHRTRPIRFLGEHRCDGWRLKLYGIAAAGEHPRPQLVAAAKALASACLPVPAASVGEAPRYGAGFVVVHDAADYGFVLFDWWSGENELHQRLFSCRRDRPDALTPHGTAAIACVWELAVIDFERRAWLHHVLANPAGPDLEAYFDEHAHDDV